MGACHPGKAWRPREQDAVDGLPCLGAAIAGPAVANVVSRGHVKLANDCMEQSIVPVGLKYGQLQLANVMAEVYGPCLSMQCRLF